MKISKKFEKSYEISSILQAERFKGTGTWTLPSLRFAELEALLAALRVARSAELREVLMELVESWKNVEKTWKKRGKIQMFFCVRTFRTKQNEVK